MRLYQQVVAARRDGSVLARITIVSSRAPGRAGTKTCRLLRIIAYMFLPLKRGVMFFVGGLNLVDEI